MAVSGDRALDSRLEPRDSRFGFCDGAGVGSGVGAALCEGAEVGSGVEVVFCAAVLVLCAGVFEAEEVPLCD